MPDNGTVNKPNPPLVYRTSVRSLVRPLAVVVLLEFIIFLLLDTSISRGIMLDLVGSGDPGLLAPVALLAIIVWMIRPVILLFDSRYEATSKHVRTCTGRFSLRREEVHIPYEEIKGVRARQTIMERVLDIGDVLVWTGFNQTPDVVFRKVPSPSSIAVTISDRVDQAILGMKNRPASSHQQSG